MAQHPNSLRAYRYNAIRGSISICIRALNTMLHHQLAGDSVKPMAELCIQALEDLDRAMANSPVVKVEEISRDA